MKTLLKVLGGLLAIILVLAIVLYFIAPKEFKVVKSREYAGISRDMAYPYISNFEKFNKWNPFMEADSNAKWWYGGTQGQIGDTSFWSGNDEVGVGYQTITEMNADSIGIMLEFTSPWVSRSDVWFTISGDSTNTNIVWGYKDEASFPDNVFMWLMGMESMLGAQYEKGFDNLGKVLQSAKAEVQAPM